MAVSAAEYMVSAYNSVLRHAVPLPATRLPSLWW